MAFNEFQKLPNLIELGLSFNFLQVDQLAYALMNENVVATTNARQAKSKRFDQSDHILKGHIFSTSYDRL